MCSLLLARYVSHTARMESLIILDAPEHSICLSLKLVEHVTSRDCEKNHFAINKNDPKKGDTEARPTGPSEATRALWGSKSDGIVCLYVLSVKKLCYRAIMTADHGRGTESSPT